MKITLTTMKDPNPDSLIPTPRQWTGKLEHRTHTSFAHAFTPQEVLDQLLSAWVLEQAAR